MTLQRRLQSLEQAVGPSSAMAPGTASPEPVDWSAVTEALLAGTDQAYLMGPSLQAFTELLPYTEVIRRFVQGSANAHSGRESER